MKEKETSHKTSIFKSVWCLVTSFLLLSTFHTLYCTFMHFLYTLDTIIRNNIYIYHNELAIAFGVRKISKKTKCRILVFFISFQMSYTSLDMMKYCMRSSSFKKSIFKDWVSAPINSLNSLCVECIWLIIKWLKYWYIDRYSWW